MNRHHALLAALAAMAICLCCASTAWAADAWQGSGLSVPAWTKSRTVPVSYTGTYDLSEDGGTWTDPGNIGPAIMFIQYALATDSSFSPSWQYAENMDPPDPLDTEAPVVTIWGDDTVGVSKGDGVKHVYAMYLAQLENFDPAQDPSPLYTATTRLDTIGPTTSAPYPAACARGTFVSLRFSAHDNMSPKVRISILIRRGRTRIKSVVVGWRKTGKAFAYRFKCHLARGSYKFTVGARDLAGNRQSKTSTNSLTVY